MASENNAIDSLEIKLRANANAAVKAVTKLQDALHGASDAVAELSAAGNRLGGLTKGVKGFSQMGKGASSSTSRIKALGKAMEGLAEMSGRAGGAMRSGANRIINSIRQIKQASGGLSSASNSIRNMIAAMIGFRGIQGIASMVKETIRLGSALTEIDHIVESVFGNMAGYVDTWAKNAISEFGIAEHSAKQYAGVLSSMFQASNIGYMDAGKMSMDLVGLAGNDEYCHLAA